MLGTYADKMGITHTIASINTYLKTLFRLNGIRGFTTCAVVEVCFRDASAHQTCLCKRISAGVTLEEDPTSLKKAKLKSAIWEGPISGQLSARAAGTGQTRYRGPGLRGKQLKERAGLFGQ